MDCLILRFDAPLMSFGSVVVDENNPTWRFPGTSMLAGLLGNALGWDHRDVDKLQALQGRLRFAARWDAWPEPLTDYQTVNLGQSFMVDTGWTTRGRREDRGGVSKTKTHQRWRDYWANGVMTLALGLDGEQEPTIDCIETALKEPARPLYIGRKPCLPAAPILVRRKQSQGVRDALVTEPLADIGHRRRAHPIPAMWPLDEGEGAASKERYDLRDWVNNIHRGSRWYAVGNMEMTA